MVILFGSMDFSLLLDYLEGCFRASRLEVFPYSKAINLSTIVTFFFWIGCYREDWVLNRHRQLFPRQAKDRH